MRRKTTLEEIETKMLALLATRPQPKPVRKPRRKRAEPAAATPARKEGPRGRYHRWGGDLGGVVTCQREGCSVSSKVEHGLRFSRVGPLGEWVRGKWPCRG